MQHPAGFSLWRATLSSVLAALAAAALNLPVSIASEAAPVLVVPSSRSTLHVAVDLPAGAAVKLPGVARLVELGGPGTGIVAQVTAAVAVDGTAQVKQGRIVADIPPRDGAAGPRRFRLEAVKEAGAQTKGFCFTDLDKKTLKLADGDKPVMAYNYGTITDEKVPKKDSRRSRACYVHPLWGLGGEVLTDDFPRDHYHHHGVFWSWPHVGIDGKEYDLWTYKNISLQFVKWLGRETGPVAAVLGVENGWFVGDKKVMVERVWLRTSKVADDARALDIDFVWIPQQPITLRGAEGKSYGGLTVRFAVKNAKDSVITVPKGPAKEDLPDTPLAWADLTAKMPGGSAPSGAAIFIPREHPDYPPTWLTRHYGAMCVGWPGVKGRTFEPGKPIRLSYRIWIHSTAVGVEPLQQAYDAYTAVANVKWE